MPDILITDTSCFILLSNIDELFILKKLYGSVTTTPEIAVEFGEQLPDCVRVFSAKDILKQRALELQLDKGESSAIALAIEMTGSTVILDDYKARAVALQLGVNVTGTIGVIVKAKLMGLIPSIKPLLEQIRSTNFRITAKIEQMALIEAGE